MEAEYFTITETSKLVGESSETLRKRCQAGAIKGAINKGKTWLIPKSYVFKVKISKPPIPLLWLDTWVILRLAKAVKSQKATDREKAWGEEMFDKITSLTDKKKILCPEADQGIEIETGGRLVDEARELQAQISRGIRIHYHQAVEDLQIQRVMKAYIEKKNSVTLPWDDLFSENPIRELDRKSPYIVSVHSNPSPKDIEKRKRVNRSIADDWEAIRKEANQRKEKYEDRLQLELRGRANSIVKITAYLLAKRIHHMEATVDDMLKAMDIMGKPLSWWGHYCKKEEDFFGLIKFYMSEEFKQIPAVDVSSSLVSKLVTDHEQIRPSDVMDVNQISAVLPYAHYMVLDGPMRDKIVYKLKLDRKHDAKIIKIQDLPELLENLSKRRKPVISLKRNYL